MKLNSILNVLEVLSYELWFSDRLFKGTHLCIMALGCLFNVGTFLPLTSLEVGVKQLDSLISCRKEMSVFQTCIWRLRSLFKTELPGACWLKNVGSLKYPEIMEY